MNEMILLKAEVISHDGDVMTVRVLNGFGEPEIMMLTENTVRIPQ